MNCNHCGKELADDAMFCGKCGHRIEKLGNVELVEDGNDSNASKKIKAVQIAVVIALLVIACIVIFFVIYKKNIKPKMELKKLPELSTVEFQLNDALNSLFGTESGHEMSNFEIKDVEGENYDKSFSCEALNGDAMICGQVKDGHVIQIQTIIMVDTEGHDISEETVAAFMGISIFPLAIYDDSVNELEDYNRVRNEMEEIEDYGNYGYAGRYVNGDIETCIGGGGTGNTLIVAGNIRFLPEFGEGFFSEDLN